MGLEVNLQGTILQKWEGIKKKKTNLEALASYPLAWLLWVSGLIDSILKIGGKIRNSNSVTEESQKGHSGPPYLSIG